MRVLNRFSGDQHFRFDSTWNLLNLNWANKNGRIGKLNISDRTPMDIASIRINKIVMKMVTMSYPAVTCLQSPAPLLLRCCLQQTPVPPVTGCQPPPASSTEEIGDRVAARSSWLAAKFGVLTLLACNDCWSIRVWRYSSSSRCTKAVSWNSSRVLIFSKKSACD